MRFTNLDSKIEEIPQGPLTQEVSQRIVSSESTCTFHCPNFKQFFLRTMFSDLGTVVT